MRAHNPKTEKHRPNPELETYSAESNVEVAALCQMLQEQNLNEMKLLF